MNKTLRISITAVLMTIAVVTAVDARAQNNQLPATYKAEVEQLLPPKIIQFIQLHFKGQEIARIERNFKKNRHIVQLFNGQEVEFDNQHEWLEVEGEGVPLPKSIIDLIPAKAVQHIAKNYPRRGIVKIEKEFFGYEIELSNSTEILFTKTGEFIKEE